jgi:hypothetical protein
MNMLQGQQQQNPLSSLLAQSQSPSPNILGSGAANIAGDLLELQRMAKEAALNGDFEKADAIAKKIQELQSQQK